MKLKVLFVGLGLLISVGMTVDAEAQTRATVINGSSFEIYELYISASHQSRWGTDQLGDEILENGDSLTLSGMRCGDYDIRIVDEDSDECVINEIYLCGDEGDWVLTDEELLECQGFVTTTASVTLANRSSWDIYQLYLSASNNRRWGPDQLGSEVLESGYTFTMSGLACGNYDLRLVDEDDDVCEVHGIYLCGAEGETSLTDKDLLDCQGF